jgi:dTDP-4-amino-4,6-dideoxygalactose transaminase
MAMLRRRLFGRRHDKSFADSLRALTGASHCYLLNSGRASLATALNAMAKLSSRDKNEVIIPAYTCFTVAASVVNSGLRVRIVDIDPGTLDYDFGKLGSEDMSRVVAIVGCNMLGIPSDWTSLRTLAEDRECFLIDDAAQALGSRTKFGALGMSGHAGIFSFGRGKNLSTYSGGAVVTSDQTIASEIEKTLSTTPKPSAWNDISALANIALYALLIRPRIYWFPAMLPFLGLGKTVFDPNFEIQNLGAIQSSAGAALLSKLDDFNDRRRQNAEKLATALSCTGKYEIPGRDDSAPPPYLRFPVVCVDKKTRDNAIAQLKRAGISASTMYPSTIRRIPGIERYLASDKNDFPGAQAIVDRMLVLPTHPLLNDSDIDRMISCLAGRK